MNCIINTNIMLNKRKKCMDPTKINNYNKLLTTIDKNTSVTNYNLEPEKNIDNKLKIKIDKLELDKLELDKIDLDKNQ